MHLKEKIARWMIKWIVNNLGEFVIYEILDEEYPINVEWKIGRMDSREQINRLTDVVNDYQKELDKLEKEEE